MKNEDEFHLTREKHLDHMVKIVPVIVFFYAVQSFIILKVSPGQFSSVSLSVLGGFLALMVSAFIIYDLHHKIILKSDKIEINFFFYRKTILFSQISDVIISEPGQSFSHLTLKTKSSKFYLYCVDDAEKVKNWIISRRTEHQAAA